MKYDDSPAMPGVWNKSNLRSILAAFVGSKRSLLCPASAVFSLIWYRHKWDIQAAAAAFLRAHADYKEWHAHHLIVLFFKKGHISDKEARQIRIDFLKHELQRLAEPNHPTPQPQ